MVVLLMIILWTNATVAPIVVSCLVLLPMLYSAMLSAITSVDQELLEMSQVYGVSKKRIIKSLYLPSVFPTFSRESLSALTFALKLTVSSEIMSNTFQSLGGQMQTANLYAQTPTVFALAFVVFLTGFVIEGLGNFLILRIERRVL
jgi:NitT/TauT family transport system permease protein